MILPSRFFRDKKPTVLQINDKKLIFLGKYDRKCKF